MKRYVLLCFLAGLSCFLRAQAQYGISFDGAAGSLQLCAVDDLAIEEGFTVEAWVYSPQWKAEVWQGSIVNTDAQGPDAGWALRAGQSGRLNLVMSVDNRWFEVTTEAVMNANQWYHVAATVEAGEVNLYIGGAAVASGSFTGSPTPSSAPLTVGDSPGFPGRVFNGVIDEVRVWNYARTGEQLASQQTADLTGAEEGLVTYLPFREGAGASSTNLAREDCAATLVDLGESAWAEGYSVPAIDVGVSGLTAPDALALFDRPVKASVTIKNYGSEAVADVPVTLFANDERLLEATFAGPIPAGGEAEMVFDQPVDLRLGDTQRLTAATNVADDPNSLNDAATVTYERPATINGNPAISIFSLRQHNFGSAGQTQSATVNLPRNVEDYSRLILHLSVACPTTGCDPWDQTGNITVVTPEGDLEIARFVTPYLIPCGGPEWTVDVTDFKDFLTGPVDFKSYIQVWGPSGWLLNADLELVAGQDPRYLRSTPIYNTQYHVYGDPNIDDDLPARTASIAATTEAAHFRLTMSGHGQGNTENAAEFLERTHELLVNGQKVADHLLWKSDCAQNECANQAGTWEFNRAGWCPGQAVQPWAHTLDPALAGTEIVLDYELQEYTNLRNTGYDGRGHTEPFYRIAGYLVESSGVAYDVVRNLRADSLALLVGADPGDPAGDQVVIYVSNTGTETISGATVAYYLDGTLVSEESLADDLSPGEQLAYTFTAPIGAEDYSTAGVIARVTSEGDDNVSDDATAKLLLPVSTTAARTAGLRIYPNPTSGSLTLELTEGFLGGRVEEVDVAGRVLSTRVVTNLRQRMTLTVGSGLRLLRIADRRGRLYYQKVVVR